MEPLLRPDFDPSELHEALAGGLGVPLRHGSGTHVAERLSERLREIGVKTGVSPTRYSNVRRKRAWSLDTLAIWCGLAGVRLSVSDGRIRFDTDHG